jgi:hypothetical protein
VIKVVPFGKIIYVILCISAGAGLLCSCVRTTDAVSPQSNQSVVPSDKVEVVYFHRSRRCEACTYAEKRTSYIVKTYFQDEMASGKLTFGIYDIEDNDNAALAKKFGAIGSQLFINSIKDGIDHIRYVDEIWYWGCIDNEEVFDRTVKDVIKKALYGEG